MLETRKLLKRYRGRTVLDGVSVSVEKGEVVGLLGPNGAGKTTCFQSVIGLVRPDGGDVLLDGDNVTDQPMHRRALRGLGYLPQETSAFRHMDVSDNIAAALELRKGLRRSERRSELARLMDDLQITHLRHQKAVTLSGGECRRVEIARALAARPGYMLLDEPFAGIDPISVGDIRSIVKHLTNRGIGVLITDHNVRETLGMCHRAYILVEGHVLAEGAPSDIVANESVRDVYLGADFEL